MESQYRKIEHFNKVPKLILILEAPIIFSPTVTEGKLTSINNWCRLNYAPYLK